MAITEYYVDPAINANSGTGTIGDPFGDLQYALDTVTRDATNGDRFNVKAGTAEVLAAGLSLATYGTPSNAAPLVIQGYTATAGDGGIGEIDGDGTYSIYSSAANSNKNIYLVDLKMGNSGAAVVVTFYQTSVMHNCEIYGSSAAYGAYITASNKISNCYFHDLTGGECLRLNGANNIIYACRFTSSGGTYLLNANFQYAIIIGCLFEIDTDTSLTAIRSASGGSVFIGNTIYSASANSGIGIHAPNQAGFAANNVIAGFSGAGGIGMICDKYAFLANNAFYNCTTNISGEASSIALSPNITLAADPFVNAAGGNFEIDGDSDASEAAWPQAFKGLATTANAADIGAVQSGAGSGGGVSIYTRSVRVIKG